jgi:hypothetical protein
MGVGLAVAKIPKAFFVVALPVTIVVAKFRTGASFPTVGTNAVWAVLSVPFTLNDPASVIADPIVNIQHLTALTTLRRLVPLFLTIITIPQTLLIVAFDVTLTVVHHPVEAVARTYFPGFMAGYNLF